MAARASASPGGPTRLSHEPRGAGRERPRLPVLEGGPCGLAAMLKDGFAGRGRWGAEGGAGRESPAAALDGARAHARCAQRMPGDGSGGVGVAGVRSLRAGGWATAAAPLATGSVDADDVVL